MTYQYQGRVYTLQQYPHMVKGEPRYHAMAEDRAGNRCYLFWDILPTYDWEIQYEFDACDWNNPSAVVETLMERTQSNNP